MKVHHPQGLARFFRDPFLPRIFPELQLCRNDVERERVKKLAQGAWMQQLVMSVGLMTAYIVEDRIVNLRSLLPSSLPYPVRVVIDLLAMLAFIGLLVYGGLYLFREPARRKIRAYLRAQGLLICETCGYDLRGLVDSTSEEGQCPECGQRLLPTRT